MSSLINTNSLDVNYPVPGQNNSSQGFRTNFQSTKNNLDIAAAEITDLQNNVVVKSALSGQSVDNDMNGTLIKAALTQNFRNSILPLGTNLTGTVNIDTSRADVFTGTITGNVQFTFTNWPPTNTERTISLDLTVSNSTATITFPSAVQVTGDWGAQTLENVQIIGGTAVITVPAGVTRLTYELTTQDCGTTISIQPVNRGRKAAQIINRTPTNIGLQGDRAGAVCFDSTYIYICVGNYDGTTQIWRRISLSTY